MTEQDGEQSVPLLSIVPVSICMSVAIDLAARRHSLRFFPHGRPIEKNALLRQPFTSSAH